MNTENALKQIVKKLESEGITDESELAEIIMRDYSHLLPTPSLREAQEAAAQNEILAANRESMKLYGHPAFVCMRIDGAMKYKAYSMFSDDEIRELKASGIIPE